MIMSSRPVITAKKYDIRCVKGLKHGYQINNKISLGRYDYIYQNSNKPKGISWLEAEEECQKVKGHLVSVHSSEEVDEIRKLLLPLSFSPAFYFGLQIWVRIS